MNAFTKGLVSGLIKVYDLIRGNHIRPIVICVFRRANDILVARWFDEDRKTYTHRPLGGGIEYGEKSADAIRREIKEEIGAEIKNLRFLRLFETIFTHSNGRLSHQLVITFEADFVEPRFYETDNLEAYEDFGIPFTAIWKDIGSFHYPKEALYPVELLTLLKKDSRPNLRNPESQIENQAI